MQYLPNPAGALKLGGPCVLGGLGVTNAPAATVGPLRGLWRAKAPAPFGSQKGPSAC
jgi:hypothetical protein